MTATRLPLLRGSSDAAGAPGLLLLHGKEEAQPGDMLAFADGLGDFSEVVAPVGLWGTYVGAMDLNAYCWYQDLAELPAPEPCSFGRSLLDLEAVVDELEPAPLVVIGVGQGATMALALADVLPERLAAVVAFGGVMTDLPAGAVVGQVAGDDTPTLWLAAPDERTREAATARGWTVEPARHDLGPETKSRVSDWLKEALD